MNKTRIKKLEEKTENKLALGSGAPIVWRPEDGKVAIQESPFILDKLRSLRREIIYSPYTFSALIVEATDSEIVDRIEGRNLYLKGLKNFVAGLPELIFI